SGGNAGSTRWINIAGSIRVTRRRVAECVTGAGGIRLASNPGMSIHVGHAGCPVPFGEPSLLGSGSIGTSVTIRGGMCEGGQNRQVAGRLVRLGGSGVLFRCTGSPAVR